jgi:molybdopterin molybdotransferase
MLSVEDAQLQVMAEVEAGATEAVPFGEASGRVLREDVVADRDAPPGDNSAMDGYAVRAADIARAPARLRVIGDIAAGHPPATPVAEGNAMRIMTGALLPEGADTVVQVELTDGGMDSVRIDRALARGTSVRRRGEDMRAGQLVLGRGTRIGPSEMALLAALQRTTVIVGRRPSVAILSTGDELIGIADPPVPGKIVNTNGPLIEALVRDTGAAPRQIGIVRDSREETIAAFRTAMESDFVISSGGVSVGAYDFVKEALESLGAVTKFWRVAMKPGKPVVLSRAGNCIIFGLPGNPASCFVSFHLFVAPALRRALGAANETAPVVRARLTSPVRSTGERRLFVRVRLVVEAGSLVATPLATQGSGALTSLVGANGLAVVDEGVRSVDAGDEVAVVLVGAIT